MLPASTVLDRRNAWGRVEELFHAALAHPAGRRRDFLAAACRGDQALRREVASLLAALEQPEGFGETAVSKLALHLTTAAQPERIGPYRLLEVLGEGGMGTVYLAEQSDPLPRRVALKLMRWGGGDGEALRRFELEREAMARMSHPNVAQVFDAGATEHGQPYVVLEHIPGLPVTEYCDSRRLDVRQRLRLLAAVCDGVRHAHEKGVLHRDLKPSNILVSDVPGGSLPKIIDFGIAKALEPWKNPVATASRRRVGSPGYMSPEALAAGGRAVDTRSDVYSLGVVLCELLVGVRPFDTPPYLGEENEGQGGDPPRPSQRLRGLPPDERRRIARARRLDESRLSRLMRSELDWIVLRAVAGEPPRRYGSAAELAADIEAWMEGRPVEARPLSFAYRMRKAVRRHRVAFTAAGLILTTVVGSSIRSNILYARAEAARAEAEELVGFMLDDLSEGLEPLGRLDLLESVSRKSLEYFDSSVDGHLEKAGRRPATALRQIGRVLATRGDLEAAFEAYERARKLDQRRFEERPGDSSCRLDLADDLKQLSRVHETRRELAASRARLAEAEAHLRRVSADFPEHFNARLALADLLARHAAPLRHQRGDVAGAQSVYGEALAIMKELLRTRPGDPEARHALGDVYYGRGLLTLFSLGDSGAAIRDFEAGISVFRDLAEIKPEASIWRYRLAVLNGQGLATAYSMLDRLTEANEANLEALALLNVLVREEPGNGRWAHGLGWEFLRQGNLARSGGELEVAAMAYGRSVEVQAALVEGTTGVHSAWLEGLAAAYAALAEVRSQSGEFAAALEVAEASLATRRRMVGDEVREDSVFDVAGHASIAVVVAELRIRAGDVEGALETLDEAGAIVGRITAADLEDFAVRAELAATSLRRGEALRGLDRSAAARDAFESCVRLLELADIRHSGEAHLAEIRSQALSRLGRDPETVASP